MKNILFICVMLVSLVSYSSNLVFSRLDKLYAKDKNKCLEVSKRYIKWIPNNPAPYYFTSAVYLDKSKNARSLQGKTRNIRKAVDFASQFEKKANDQLLIKVNWEEYRRNIIVDSEKLINELRMISETVLSNQLLSKLRKLNQKSFLIDIEEGNEIYEVTERIEKLSTTSFDVSAGFNGMPLGIEDVPSHDYSKEIELLRMINEERKRLGLSTLLWDENLARAGRFHAYDLATQNYFNHDTYDRSGNRLIRVGDTFERIMLFYKDSSPAAENIAAGNASPNETYLQWFHSKGHYNNMFDPEIKKVGIGVFYNEDSPFGYYWVLDTAR